ncbi:LicD family protein [Segetibacter aerophilus]|uniref:LicD/FKTN/FKRP nucleotidyltransferase domain-containing protein n=1 Tax=Segetibacter aerophilus TaxID=670293 RepID=A0A512BHE4_9BACT|nr:LicD family protein [Segetibacter aerophilus]GEO11237.1 hypothetical protein SAE01_37330 [Segetibacter aerophilus]
MMNGIPKSVRIDEQDYYYEEIYLVNGTKKMNVNIATENLKIFHSLVSQSKITYGLFFGTLLGAIREKNFIVHDEDTDIYVLSEDKEKFLSLLFKFKELGLILVRCQENLISLMRADEYIDVYFFRPKRKLGFFKVRILENHNEYSAKNLEEPVLYHFLGIELYIPHNPEKILKELYGKNWRIPIANSPAPYNTFYTKISKIAPYLKHFPLVRTIQGKLKYILSKI